MTLGKLYWQIKAGEQGAAQSVGYGTGAKGVILCHTPTPFPAARYGKAFRSLGDSRLGVLYLSQLGMFYFFFSMNILLGCGWASLLTLCPQDPSQRVKEWAEPLGSVSIDRKG